MQHTFMMKPNVFWKKVQDWKSVFLRRTSRTTCASLGKTINLSEPLGHHLQKGLKNTCPPFSEGSRGGTKVLERALEVKYYIERVYFSDFSVFLQGRFQVTLPSRMKRERRERGPS